MKNFRDLQVWEKAHLLALDAYRVTNASPRHELFGLTSQIRRAAVSIAANLAEGCGNRGNGEFQRYLNIACGSSSELEYHFLLPTTCIWWTRLPIGASILQWSK